MNISFITDYWSRNPKTINEGIILAKPMVHSIGEQLQYIKILNFKQLYELELKSSSSSIPSSLSFLSSSYISYNIVIFRFII